MNMSLMPKCKVLYEYVPVPNYKVLREYFPVPNHELLREYVPVLKYEYVYNNRVLEFWLKSVPAGCYDSRQFFCVRHLSPTSLLLYTSAIVEE